MWGNGLRTNPAYSDADAAARLRHMLRSTGCRQNIWIRKIKYKKDVAGQIREYRLEDNGEFGANPKRLAVSTCGYKSESTTYYRYAVIGVVIVCVTGYK